MADLSTKEGIKSRINRIYYLIDYAENNGDYEYAEELVEELRWLEDMLIQKG